MSELRQNRITGEWVVMASERSARPTDYKKSNCPILPDRKPECPFCPGNERYTPCEEFAFRKKGSWPNEKGWSVRVVPNKYPALSPDTDFKWIYRSGFFTGVEGYGHHEVLIETPSHNRSIALLTPAEARKVFFAYRQRARELEKKEDILLVTIFRNHGQKAGASLEHPHSQILATPIIPAKIQRRLDVARDYYSDHGRCIFCDLMKQKSSEEEMDRVVMETERFIAVHPYASQAPFETWIAPKNHRHSFAEVPDKELQELANVARNILRRIYVGLGDPDYNFVIQANPARTRFKERYHWYMQILPRVSQSVGFELCSGIFITTADPKDTARIMREVDPDAATA